MVPASLGWGRVSAAPSGEVGLGRLGAHGWGQGPVESGLRHGAEPAGTCLLATTETPVSWQLSRESDGVASSPDCHLDFGQIACPLEFSHADGNTDIFRRVLGRTIGGGGLETIYRHV